jgi:hypothetical protein
MNYTLISDTETHEIREYETSDEMRDYLDSRCKTGDFKLILDYRQAWIFPERTLCILDEKGVWHKYYQQLAWYEDSRDHQKVARVQIHGRRYEEYPMSSTFYRSERDYSFPWEQVCLLGKQRTEKIEQEKTYNE